MKNATKEVMQERMNKVVSTIRDSEIPFEEPSLSEASDDFSCIILLIPEFKVGRIAILLDNSPCSFAREERGEFMINVLKVEVDEKGLFDELESCYVCTPEELFALLKALKTSESFSNLVHFDVTMPNPPDVVYA